MDDNEIPNWLKGLPLAPEFHPTETEFADPIAYISKIEKEAGAFGICKVIPPLPKPSKRFVLAHLNKSLLKCPELGSDVSSCSPSQVGLGERPSDDETRAVFTTRHQELGTSSKRLRGPLLVRQLPVQKQVWQSGEVYTLEQFESKSRAFARSRLSGVKEVSPLGVESLFWKAASEKPIYVEYANDVPGSGFGEPEEPFRYIHKRQRRRRFYRRQQGSIGLEKHERDLVNLNESSKMGEVTPLLETSSSLEENMRLSRQKSLINGSSSDKESSAGWKISNSPWNLQVIARSKGSLTRFMPDDIPGVTSPMVYIGMLFSWFAWHVEDHELHSLNFLHMGAPKTWYAVPGEYAFALEEVVRVQGYGGHTDRLASLTLLGEKTTLLSPEVFISSGIPCCRLVQHPGEFVVTFPRAYHVGFSHGFNCGEAANFATSQWLKVAKEAAVRRAAMNYLPMLSHQQLLYLLTMSFVSRVPTALLPGVRSSRLKDRQKEEREVLVKKAFLDDMMIENHRLVSLLGKSPTSYAVLWDPDRLPSTNNGLKSSAVADDSTLEYEKDHSSEENKLHECLDTVCRKIFPTDCQKDDRHNDKVDSLKPHVERRDVLYCDDDDLPCGFHVDSGTLACVACGVLGFPFMCVVQPSERGSKELFHEQHQAIHAGLGNTEPKKHEDKVVEDFESDAAKLVDVEFEAIDQQDGNQIMVLCPSHKEHAPAEKTTEAGRNFQSVDSGLPEGSCETSSMMREVSTDDSMERSDTPCDPVRATSSSRENLSSFHDENNLEFVTVCSQVPVSLPNSSPNGNMPEINQFCPIMDIDTRNGTGGDGYMKNGRSLKQDRKQSDFGLQGCHKTGLDEATVRSVDKLNRQWNKSLPLLRPRIFCLEHALEIEELLQCHGGANVLVICHSDYPKIKAQAPYIAEEVGVPFSFKDIPLETASEADLDLINISIDDENEEFCEDWTSKLGVNLHYCVRIRKLSPLKNEQHALALGGLFSDHVSGLNISTLRWKSRKSRSHHKGAGLGHSRSQGHHMKTNENKLGNYSGEDIIRNRAFGILSELNSSTKASRSRSRSGRPKKSPKIEAGNGTDIIDDNMSHPVSKSNGSESDQVLHWNENLGNSSSELVDLSNVVGPLSLSPQACKDLENTLDNLTSETRHHSMVPVSSAADIPTGVTENQQKMQAPGCNNLAIAACNVKRSVDLSEVSISEVQTIEEIKKATEVSHSTSSVNAKAMDVSVVDSSEVHQEQEIMGGIFYPEPSKIVSQIQATIHVTEETPISDNEEHSLKSTSSPKPSDPTAQSYEMRREVQNTDGIAILAVSYDSVKSTDDRMFITSVMKPEISSSLKLSDPSAESSKMQPEVQCTGETVAQAVSCHLVKSADDCTFSTLATKPEIFTTDESSNDSINPATPTSCAISTNGTSEVALDTQMTTDENSLTGGNCDFLKQACVSIMCNSMPRKSSEVQQDGRVNQTEKICSTEDRVESSPPNPILVYSRIGKDRRKRKGALDQKREAEESCSGFARSPCEGLRPRAWKNATGMLNVSRNCEEIKPRKKTKVIGCRDVEASQVCDLDDLSMSFRTKAELQLHKCNRCTHNGCGKRFSSHKYSLHHQRVHHNERPLKCPWKGCKMSFKWAWARTEHMRLHTGERPYQCKVVGCGLTFRFVSDFSRHRRKTGHSLN